MRMKAVFAVDLYSEKFFTAEAQRTQREVQGELLWFITRTVLWLTPAQVLPLRSLRLE
jgi:hypothetical protein